MKCNYHSVSFKKKKSENSSLKFNSHAPGSHTHLSVMQGFLKNPTEYLSFFLFSSEIYDLGLRCIFLAVTLCHYATSQHSNTPLRPSQERGGSSLLALNKISVSVSQKLVTRGPSFWLYHF